MQLSVSLYRSCLRHGHRYLLPFANRAGLSADLRRPWGFALKNALVVCFADVCANSIRQQIDV
jgi:hypothetical protein